MIGWKKIHLTEVTLVLPDAAIVDTVVDLHRLCMHELSRSQVCFCVFLPFMFLFSWEYTSPAKNRKMWWILKAGVTGKMSKAAITLITVHSFLLWCKKFEENPNINYMLISAELRCDFLGMEFSQLLGIGVSLFNEIYMAVLL